MADARPDNMTGNRSRWSTGDDTCCLQGSADNWRTTACRRSPLEYRSLSTHNSAARQLTSPQPLNWAIGYITQWQKQREIISGIKLHVGLGSNLSV